MLYLHRKHGFLSKTSKLSSIRLLIGLGAASLHTIWSLYFSSLGLNESTIGFISAGLVVLSLLFLIISTPILEKLGEYVTLKISILFCAITALGMFMFNTVSMFILLVTL